MRTCRPRIATILLQLVLINVAFACRGTAYAEDNPFGLPVPYQKEKPGTVILHGGGWGDRRVFQRRFAELVHRAGGDRAKVLFMPSESVIRGYVDDAVLDGGESQEDFEARLGSNENYGDWKRAAQDRGLTFQFIYRDEIGDEDDELIVAAIRGATGVWFNAADQTWLPELFAAEDPQTLSPVVKELRDLLSRGGVVGALGGAMSSLPETTINGNLGDGDSGWILPELGFGLGLLNGVVVEKDFSNHEGRLERFAYLLRKGPKHDPKLRIAGIKPRAIGIGVSHHTAAILQGHTIEAIGDGSVEVFVPSHGDRTITWHNLKNGDQLAIEMKSAPTSALTGEDPANGNPFGLPMLKGKVAPGTVVLHGGGSTSDMYEHIAKLAAVPQPVVVHCPTASDSLRPLDASHDKKIESKLRRYFHEWCDLEKSWPFKELTFIKTRSTADARNPEFVAPLNRANAMWFSGGSQARLSKFFVSEDHEHPTLFQEAVVGIVQRGGVVGGTSAGLAIMPAIVIVPDDDDAERCTLYRGFGLLRNVLAEQHFDARHGRIKRLTDLMWNGPVESELFRDQKLHNHIGLAVEERTSVTIQGDQLRILGEQNVHVLLRSRDAAGVARAITWHILHPGDIGTIRSTSTGFVLDLNDWQAIPSGARE